MKKILLLLVLLSISAASAFAEIDIDGFYYELNNGVALKKLSHKIQNMEVVTREDIPYGFWWELSATPTQDCPECTNIFYLALKKHNDNPQNYIAAFNYAMLIAYKNAPLGGYFISVTEGEEGKRVFDEAYKRFEKAKEINRNFGSVYVEQEILIDRYLFSHIYYSPNRYSLDLRLEGYTKHRDLARKRLSLIEKQISLGIEGVNFFGDQGVNYLEASVLARFLGLYEKEALYTERAGGKKAIQNEVDFAVTTLHALFDFLADTSEFKRLSGAIYTAESLLGILNKYYESYVKQVESYGKFLEDIRKAKVRRDYLLRQAVNNPHSLNLP